MSATVKQKLTHSRMACAKSCMRKHQYRYDMGLIPDNDATALRIGSAIHYGIEQWCKGVDPEKVIADVFDKYAVKPISMNDDAFDIEKVTVQCLLSGYMWYYSNDEIEHIEVEKSFSLPLINPETGASSRTFTLDGKRDGVIRMNGRLFVKEIKTTSDDINDGSNYWLRLRCDQQISLYILAARLEGLEPEAVLYDVIRKPSIRQCKATPVDKRKYTKENKLYANQREFDETPEEFKARLWEDITERPEFYFQRREIPRLHDDLEAFKYEAWQIADMLRKGYNFRNVSRSTCDFCEFKSICLQSITVNPAAPPAGFTIAKNINPELEDN